MNRQPAPWTKAGGRSPFLVAHRAGNYLADLKAAEQLGVGQIEADVRLHRGKLEVRHLKTIGPLPILWDRWKLAAPWHPRLQLHELLSALAPETDLLLDLKGPRKELGTRVLDAIRPYLGERDFTVCARSWRVLETFAGLSVRRVHSVGSARQLRRLQLRFAGERLDGISIHERLLDRDSVASLRVIADVIMTWPVNVPERARELVRLGVDGLITDDVAGLVHAGVLEATA
ncbi:MAG: glycerophosphodiester phosphodiesterase [Thermoleophilia bacterium]|nr:glycerophosphodiester phosphodiesterase [Thermoleophilia bacterium]MDH4340579.1 glycerophosphodiester phosphodiesterase [Thermoleophilia bacterium]MDH5282227.1 glycerophosphodiester phosphodiesterase [Thermoleophilia bacterium]